MDLQHLEAEVFVAIGFAIFIAILLKLRAPHMLVGAIDSRIDKVKGELAEAQRLRSEAEALLASFEQKKAEAEAEAAAIIAAAKVEAEMIASESRKRLDEWAARGDKQISDKIAVAEAQAIAEVRAAAADAATKIAEAVLRAQPASGDSLVTEGIRGLKALRA
jgi:F-type H+-transporting ATPase subunit b